MIISYIMQVRILLRYRLNFFTMSATLIYLHFDNQTNKYENVVN
ncbi:hypothetical protein BDD30_4443 [Photorhabdus asymbiotica]|uniref:Uncharacterized protein n=1 Tax=Photorhabdus asymbiotica TaxID=291112 RepID=A0ABX9SJK4_9GAMM|nr:hypothetical protein BDD30_4443 [Photorhabdus asymbiotica]